ncbi:MAG: hypothetical protein K9H26_08130 [Prolixibacteraceae bacterium]|nr:hypothetical protein [Prolixibacteraceae bacterium]
MKKKEKILIQQKIDGVLPPADEKRVDEILKKSGKARAYFEKLARVDKALKNDAEKPLEVDVANRVMKTITKKNHQPSISKIKPIRLYENRFLKYAAVLFFGLLLGATAGWFIFSNPQTGNTGNMAGTIATPPGEHAFSDELTSIKIQQFNTSEYLVALVTIETKKELNCEITDNLHVLMPNDIIPLSTNRFLAQTTNNERTYRYTIIGPTVFQIITENNNGLDIKFIRNSQILAHKKIKRKETNF